MRRFSAVLAVGLCAILAAGVWAEEGKEAGKGGRRGPGGPGGRGPRGPGGAGFQELIKKFDKDGDGKLSDDERTALRDAMPKGGFKGGPGGGKPGAPGGRGGEFMKKFDKDGDGKLNDAEKTAAREAFGGRRPEGKKKPE